MEYPLFPVLYLLLHHCYFAFAFSFFFFAQGRGLERPLKSFID
jgi:hypothetical protein